MVGGLSLPPHSGFDQVTIRFRASVSLGLTINLTIKGLTDCSQDDMLGVWYQSADLGVTDCLICAIFARQRTPNPTGVPRS